MTVAISGGGPAGLMLGLLLARQGIEVTVLEKHEDFLHDFRGDTIHPATMELLDQLGLHDRFHKIPYGKFQDVGFGKDLQIGSLTELGLRYPFVAIAPQWDFLNLIAEEAQRYPGFTLKMRAEVVDPLPEGGVRYRDRDGEHELRADLTVACDGRDSLLRARAGLPVRNIGAPFDVAWFRLPRRDPEVEEFYYRVAPYKWIVGFDRRTYIQLAYVFDKNRREKLITDGIGAFRDGVARAVPEIADRVALLRSCKEDVSFLDVQVNRAIRWYGKGLLLIGDTAHAMSPMGGVGVNYAIQDAVGAANILCDALKSGGPMPEHRLRAVQKRREPPMAVMQRLQLLMQRRLVEPALRGEVANVPRMATLMRRVHPVRRALMRLLAVGLRKENIR
ncbi:FAD-dependent oxidoreductase [Nonomuraea africana]|uniref:FAD-dependent oxidoreductase n=1 Tax=Nonomuraea africana TaxID=46171 RepID=UPI0033CF771B